MNKHLKRKFIEAVAIVNNFLVDLKKCKRFYPSDLKELDEIKIRSAERTEINDHLLTLFIEALSIQPKLIVELGVGPRGSSTFVLERVARLCGSKLISVDTADCSHASSWKDWLFVQAHDVEFVKNFKNWCKGHDIQASIDVLFIDTTHLFEHTLQEINSWVPFLSDKSKVFFHDTNLTEILFRKDGSMSYGYDNKRNAIRALERYFNKSFNEKEDFIDFKNGWIIKHFALCNGLTILERMRSIADKSSIIL